MTSTQDDSVRPEEFAEAAAAAIADAQSHDFSTTAQVLAAAGLVGVCAQESVGGLGLGVGVCCAHRSSGRQAAVALSPDRTDACG